jgi:hypothetical protein
MFSLRSLATIVHIERREAVSIQDSRHGLKASENAAQKVKFHNGLSVRQRAGI